jgi:hypothetical protein
MHDDADFADDADGDAPIEDSLEAWIWRVLLLVNPGDEDSALRQFDAWRDVQADAGGDEEDTAAALARLGAVIDWQAGFSADDAATLIQALDELAARWNLAIDWGGDADDEDFLADHELPDLLGIAYDGLREHGYTLWIYESDRAAWAGWITRSDDAEPMREAATALGINLRLALDAG